MPTPHWGHCQCVPASMVPSLTLGVLCANALTFNACLMLRGSGPYGLGGCDRFAAVLHTICVFVYLCVCVCVYSTVDQTQT